MPPRDPLDLQPGRHRRSRGHQRCPTRTTQRSPGSTRPRQCSRPSDTTPTILSGEDNQATRDAVTKLQTELGLEPTGAIDDDLYELAYYGALGTARYVAIMSRDIYDTLDPAGCRSSLRQVGPSGRGTEASARSSATLTEDERRSSRGGGDLRDRRRFLHDARAERRARWRRNWIVDCAEGKFALTFTGYDMSVSPRRRCLPRHRLPRTPAPARTRATVAAGQDQGLSPSLRGIRSPRFRLSHGKRQPRTTMSEAPTAKPPRNSPTSPATPSTSPRPVSAPRR